MGKTAQIAPAKIVSLTPSKAVLFGSYPLLNDVFVILELCDLGEIMEPL